MWVELKHKLLESAKLTVFLLAYFVILFGIPVALGWIAYGFLPDVVVGIIAGVSLIFMLSLAMTTMSDMMDLCMGRQR